MNSTRRRFLRGAGAATAALVVGCLDESTAGDSPTTGGPTQSSGRPGSETPADTTSGTTPTTNTPTRRDGSSPSPDETVTDSDPPSETPPGTPTSDAVVWRRSFGSAVETAPVVDGDAVYSATADGTVRLHDVASGSEVWSVAGPGPVQDVVVGSGALLVRTGTYELGSNQTLHALDPGSGEELWTFSPTGWWLEIVDVRDGTAYVSTADDAVGGGGETLYALSLAGGEERWSAPTGDPREGVVTSDRLYLSSYGGVHGYDVADGTELWTNEVTDQVYTSLGVVDGTVVYARRADDSDVFSVLVGVDAETGSERWRFDAWGVSSTAATGDAVYVGGGGVAALDPADGAVRWESETAGFVVDAGVSAARVYVGGDSLQAYARDDGELVWERTPEPVQGGVRPAGVTSSSVYLDAYRDADVRNRYKFAVDVESGEQRWAFEDGTGLTDLAVGSDVAVAGGGNGRLYALR